MKGRRFGRGLLALLAGFGLWACPRPPASVGGRGLATARGADGYYENAMVRSFRRSAGTVAGPDLGWLEPEYYVDDSTCRGGADSDGGIESAIGLFYAGHGWPEAWSARGNPAALRCLRFGNAGSGQGGLRYFLMASCQVMAHGPLEQGDYLKPGSFYSSTNGQVANAWYRWGAAFGPGARLACGGSSSVLAEADAAREFWNLRHSRFGLVDSFLLAFHADKSYVPLCLAPGGSGFADSPLMDLGFVDEPWQEPPSETRRLWAAYLLPSGEPWRTGSESQAATVLAHSKPQPSPAPAWRQAFSGSPEVQGGLRDVWSYSRAVGRGAPSLKSPSEVAATGPRDLLKIAFPSMEPGAFEVGLGTLDTWVLPDNASEGEKKGFLKSRTLIAQRRVRMMPEGAAGGNPVWIPQFDRGGRIVVQFDSSDPPRVTAATVDWRGTTFAPLGRIVALEAALERAHAEVGDDRYQLRDETTTWGYREVATEGETSVLAPFYRFRFRRPPLNGELIAPDLEIFIRVDEELGPG